MYNLITLISNNGTEYRFMDEIYDKNLNIKIEIGNSIELSNGKKILLSVEDGGRLVVVRLTNSSVEPRC